MTRQRLGLHTTTLKTVCLSVVHACASSSLCVTPAAGWCWLVVAAGMLEGMSRIEADAYQLLTKLGATRVTRVLTAGGGAVNVKWTAMRAAALGVPVTAAAQGGSLKAAHAAAA